MKTICHFPGKFPAVMLIAILSQPLLCISQEQPYPYKDKKYKFEVNLPKEPDEVKSAKPFLRSITSNKSANLSFLVFVNQANRNVDEYLDLHKTIESYQIVGSRKFSCETIDVVEWWGKVKNFNIVNRIIVYDKMCFQFQIVSASEIVKDYSYPFLNSIKLNGVAIRSDDYDPNLYQAFVFDPKKYVSTNTPSNQTGDRATVSTITNTTAKVALVIGIKSYTAVPPLSNTINDARDIAASLKAKGFLVIEVYDPKTKSDLRNAVLDFNKALRNNPNGVGMLYYSGHGMQVDGANYMIPAAATLEIKADVDEQCMNMDYVLRSMEENGNQLNIIVLDACRNNPFRSFSRSAEKGLSMVSAPKGSYIVYSTKPGAVASDGSGRNGLFTSKLLKFLDANDQSLEEVFKNVAAEVARDSNDGQRPWISSDYTGIFYFNKK